MGDFPSGQRGQTVNLLSLTSVVRIHHPPPKKTKGVCLWSFLRMYVTMRTTYNRLAVVFACAGYAKGKIVNQIARVGTNEKIQLLRVGFFGGGWWIRTTEVSDNRFTVCPLWPLGKSPICLGHLLASDVACPLTLGSQGWSW